MLDTSCGSGTFLYLAIKKKRRRLGDTRETPDHVFEPSGGQVMKITIAKAELLRHKKSLKIARKGSLVPSAHITLTVAETCSIVGPGFSIKLDWRPHTWGRVSMPFQVCDRLMAVLEGISHKDITVEVDDGRVQFETMVINNPEIRVVGLDKLASEIPLNLGPAEIIKMLSYGPEALRALGIWNSVKSYIKRLRKQLDKAALQLKEYGVKPEDLAVVVAQRMGIEDRATFFDLLFSED